MKAETKKGEVLDMAMTREDDRRENLKQIIALSKKDSDLEGSFIQDLFEIMFLGHLPNIKKESKQSETVVGKMNNLNNALVALIDHYAEHEKRFAVEVNKAKASGEKISHERIKEIKKELNKIRGRFEVARKLNYEILRERFEDPEEIQESRTEMRSGGEIVSKEGHYFLPDDHPSFLRKSLGTSLIRIE